MLSSAPLAQALAQIRFPLIASFETMAGIAPLQESLRSRFPYMEQQRVQELAFVVGPAGPAAGPAAESVTWNLTNDDGLTAVIGAGTATLSAGASYTGVDDFALVFEDLLTALMKLGVPRCDRLGVRYLSIAEDLPGEAGSWRRWFRDEVLGWPGSDVVPADALVSSLAQTRLSQAPVDDLAGPPADVQAAIRHGSVPKDTAVPGIPPIEVEHPSFLLDLDVFVEGHQPFDVQSLLEGFRLFHSQIDRFFYWSLTEDGKAHFGLEER
jgi:uncharacterized protein (TIGR04255 family)